MDSEIKKIFQNILVNPENHLSKEIWRSLVARENKKHLTKTIIYFSTVLVSLILLVPSILNLIDKFSLGGFSEYASLIFTDGSIIITYWKEFIFSILNSIPLMSFVLCSGLLLVLFVSIKKIIGQINFKTLTV